MKITRIVALAIIAASASLAAGQSGLQAQTLRSAGPPAEYPPASFQGKQYVDSRGCIYIRAGIDGNVNWVPRVTRSRKQICGYKPTQVAGTTARPARNATSEAPEQITLAPPEQTGRQTSSQTSSQVGNQGSDVASASGGASRKPVPVVSQPVPKPTRSAPVVVTTTKPQRSARRATTAQTKPAPRRPAAGQPVAGQPVTVRPVALQPAYRQAAATSQGNTQGACAGISAISRQYSNRAGLRCGPQAQSPVTYGSGSYRSTGRRPSQVLAPNTRVLPTHVYEDRRHSQGLTPPPGYRVAWEDDRLNLRRAERDLQPRIVENGLEVPAGFVAVNRHDNRMNPLRGIRTDNGEAQMAAIWQEGVPRKLVPLPQDRQTVVLTNTGRDRFEGDVSRNSLALRLSSRSEPGSSLQDAKQPAAQEVTRRYVRAATYVDAAQAQKAARALAAQGLPVRLGEVSRQGVPYKVVLAGPFPDLQSAKTALQQLRAAGHSGARISK
ncbi:Sporulation related domain protein [Phaeobacter sp. CECT 5382]|uniref:SPOR domain-containing protein n=1 Tax=Phaeobacter sp. CECT 5382 TaxID=1712645 RepID=UPI0006D94460|nr:SPOR domain-containing protein [Phaeobacter sp. CECT 5382]CUH86260.1 Sporulation related domain protein [Phaeobacter sp. CECT 5382]